VRVYYLPHLIIACCLAAVEGCNDSVYDQKPVDADTVDVLCKTLRERGIWWAPVFGCREGVKLASVEGSQDEKVYEAKEVPQDVL